MMRDAGAKEVHLLVASPPSVHGCYYGVDTPSSSELIAANQSVEQIREFTGADSLAYLSLDGLRKSVESLADDCCYACYTGKYPTDLVGVEMLTSQSRK